MDRRLNERVPSGVQVRAREGGELTHGQGIDISVTGILLELGREVTSRDNRGFVELELDIPESGPIRALARPVRSQGRTQALKFVHMSDMDRLALAEHIDAVVRAA